MRLNLGDDIRCPLIEGMTSELCDDRRFQPTLQFLHVGGTGEDGLALKQFGMQPTRGEHVREDRSAQLFN
jgi:hypothetical protein